MCKLSDTVNAVAYKKGVRTIEIEKGHKSGYITTTRHHDYSKPTETQPHTNLASVMAHIKNMMPQGGAK